MSRVNYGTVEVKVHDVVYTLKPTLKAMDRIQQKWPDGLRGAIGASQQLGARDLAFIIAAGAGINSREAKELPDLVFSYGSVHCAAPIIEYLGLLINPTGRESSPEDEEETEGE